MLWFELLAGWISVKDVQADMKLNPGTGSTRHRYSATYWLSVATLIGIFIVNTLGFTDTITGSAMGCGRNWPLCNGQLIPSSWNTATFIEYTHRLSVLVGGGLLIWLSISAWRKYGRSSSVRILVLLALLGVLLEGVLGALAVLFVNPPAVMAAHLGIALITFVAMVLLTDVIGRMERGNMTRVKVHRTDASPMEMYGSEYVNQLGGFSRLTWWSIPYGYVAIYIGAYVASTGYGGFFQGWPFPTEPLATAGPALWIDILHRSVALGYLAWMGSLVWLSWRFRSTRPRYFIISCIAFAFVCLQAVTGALLIETHLSDLAFLLHVTNVSFLFATQCYLGFSLLGERATGRRVGQLNDGPIKHKRVV
ncbi:MAG: COX15/CtaA family protein [Alicyclobacillus sp.]|nr:COX15/CtaA family protein [Alicyclobacillus sp.]